MLIALDYDGTYTADPALWDRFICDARKVGHQVFCVTMRFDSEDERLPGDFASAVDRIIYTGRKAKLPLLSEMDISPQVWIDDNPRWIYIDSR